jgi:hypothetical protein
MPYLHWETDRRRAKFDETMCEITEIHKKEEAAKEAKTIIRTPYYNPVTDFRIIRTVDEAMDEKFKREVKDRPLSKFSQSKVARRLIPGVRLSNK